MEHGVKDVATALLAGRFRWSEKPSSDGPGVYAYFVIEPHALLPLEVDPKQPLYVGMTDSSLDARCHFDHDHSGFSTFRRSLGAILKERLGLSALPRARGASKTNRTNYRF